MSIEYDTPFAEHRARDGISPSGAKILLNKSPAAYRYEMDHPREATPDFRIGSGTHALFDSPEAFAIECAEAPEINKRTNAGKKEWAEFLEQSAGKIVLTAQEAAKARAMAAALEANPLIRELRQQGRCEVSMTWDCPDTGAPCKGRIDLALFEQHAIGDLKTTIDGSAARFAMDAWKYGYAMQAAAYIEGAAHNGIAVTDYLIIVVEKSPPWCTAVYRLSDAAIELGMRRWKEAKAIYARCIETGEWPGYPAEIQELSAPNWAMNEFYAETEEG